MSNQEEEPESPKESSSREIPAPPPIMPKPDIKDGSREGPTYGTGKKTKDETADRSRRHPLDPYEPLKQRRGCRGIFGCLFLGVATVVGLFLVLALVVAWIGPGRYVFNDYEVVNLEEPETVISTAPDRPTCYIGQKITYEVPQTEVSVAIIGTEVVLSGDFYEDLSVTAAKFRAESSTRIAGNLEVFAAEFYDAGIELRGELSGSVMKNMHP